MLAWPDAQAVDCAVRRWAIERGRVHPEVSRIGYFGSYARGDWGVGSDLDLIFVVDAAHEPFERRATRWDAADIPVPADILVYTSAEWNALPPDSRFARTLRQEAVWVYERDAAGTESRD
ncbi:MAG: nucleotidyltransferase domain-containing protein [Bryobacterales bacterium]|nr:nucleotidyltransferase domain-containing protein [Bryobacterales bacterium]